MTQIISEIAAKNTFRIVAWKAWLIPKIVYLIPTEKFGDPKCTPFYCSKLQGPWFYRELWFFMNFQSFWFLKSFVLISSISVPSLDFCPQISLFSKFPTLHIHKKFKTLNRNTWRVRLSRQKNSWLPSSSQILTFGNQFSFLSLKF